MLGADQRDVNEPIRAPVRSLAAGAVLAAIAVVAAAALAVLRPQTTLGNAPIVMGQRSGASTSGSMTPCTRCSIWRRPG
ncbi:type VII secretion protein EccB [Mycolicibacterium vaccae]|nr:type VII secretion protein EccB [Mycolicibacterium vaccae]